MQYRGRGRMTEIEDKDRKVFFEQRYLTMVTSGKMGMYYSNTLNINMTVNLKMAYNSSSTVP